MQMHTIGSSQTRAISIAADPDAVFAFLADPTNIPSWAPEFAQRIRQDAGNWIVTGATGEFPIVVRTSTEHRTIYLLSAADERIGAFSRILPNGSGSEYLFTLLFPDATPSADIERQMATVESELEAVRELACCRG
jgi:hypothetical protein